MTGATNDSLATSNKDRALMLIDAMNRADEAGIIDLFADEGLITVMGHSSLAGSMPKSEFALGIHLLFDPFPDGLKFTVTGITTENERVALEVESYGRTVSGDVYNQFYHFLVLFRDDGQILEFKEYLDTKHQDEVLIKGQDDKVAAMDEVHKAIGTTPSPRS
jgi:ketosteroid isomerase-like protein